MINSKRLSRTCYQNNCKIASIFNYQDQKKPLYCNIHKKENMVDVKSKKCIFDNCQTQPYFNYQDQKRGIYCSEHKLQNMIDVKHKRCLFDKCQTRPSFNYQNQNKGIYCSEHKLENMIDVNSKRCIFDKCQTIPIFNYQDQNKGIYCSEHKLQNMINVVDKKCLFDKCQTFPIFNYQNQKAGIYCSEHKLENMIDVRNKRCLTPLCDIRTQKKHKGYCYRCFCYMFLNESISRNYKTKELLVQEFIKDKFEDCKIQFDKIIENGCSKRRPDVFIDCQSHILIVETDEQSHEQYETICENKRTVQLYQDCGYMNVIFIRFNPDKYINSKQEQIKSCFKIDKKTGKCVVNDKKQWDYRLKSLQNSIQYHISNIPEKSITTEYLFYNNY